MDRILKALNQMSQNPRDVRFRDLYQVCLHYFGAPRSTKSSHVVFRTPWKGDPRINIQNVKGKAKEYQVRQVLLAIETLKEGFHGKDQSQGAEES